MLEFRFAWAARATNSVDYAGPKETFSPDDCIESTRAGSVPEGEDHGANWSWNLATIRCSSRLDAERVQESGSARQLGRSILAVRPSSTIDRRRAKTTSGSGRSSASVTSRLRYGNSPSRSNSMMNDPAWRW